MGGRGSGGGNSQTRSLDWVGRLQSGNEPGMTVAQEYHQKFDLGRWSANDYERARFEGFASPQAAQAETTAHIRQHGIINPAQTSDGVLDEGFHRYAAMRQLGRKTMPIRKTD